MTNYPDDWYSARNKIIEYVSEDLLGPTNAPLNADPLTRILIGVLHPQQVEESTGTIEKENLLNSPAEIKKSINQKTSVNESEDEGVALANKAYPSSIGLTFAVNENSAVKEVSVYSSATRYIQHTEEETVTWSPDQVIMEDPLKIPVDNPALIKTPLPGTNGKLEINALVRSASNGMIRITVSLINKYTTEEFTGKKDSYCWFQPQIKVIAENGYFVDRSNKQIFETSNTELKQINFLYRNSENLAQGHGCAAEWRSGSHPVSEISTTFLPRQEVHRASAEAGSQDDPFGAFNLNMGLIAQPEGFTELDSLANAYEQWIQTRSSDLSQEPNLTSSMRDAGETNLKEANGCLARIRAGIESLRHPEIAEAFKLMNLAMIRQRDAQDSARGHTNQVKKKSDFDTEQTWRPFQIAFILMNLPALNDSEHPDREIADLLWFPTGGGKTEAYLGCIGFSIILRRLRKPEDGGVSAIMRYTLRILTTDQFLRAAGLICALESIRREFLPHTLQKISLGLWVGDKTVYNKIEDAQREHRRLKSGVADPADSSLLQVKECPNCGIKISFHDYHFDSTGMEIHCPSTHCEFHDGLPLFIIDEDVYRHRPSLVIGTVDKFAQMSWKAEVSQLLSLDGKFSTPDLIVQDELHLISGPLGTMVGLYESALDISLSNYGTGKPKIIASTATIRSADEQVRAIFDRKSKQFPPAGIHPDDNYFSKSADRATTGTREYVGVIAPGTSQATLLVRLYAALLQGVCTIDMPDAVRDTYWTLLGYFNSLRVLGSAYLQAVDDVPRRMEVIAKRRGEPKRENHGQAPRELTSRATTGEILTTRALMEKPFPDPSSPGIVLATNMISVGLDIDRLGLMVVAGQPQNTSEYIQATSRVGRRYPGLVFVAFNGQRSRDVSHFESFIPFHRSLYRAVEATTATPFSARARDRGAHGVLVAAIRLALEELRADNAAEAVEDFAGTIRDRIIAPLVRRAQNISAEDASPFETRLEELLQEWIRSVNDNGITKYGSMGSYPSKNSEGALMEGAGAKNGFDQFEADEMPWQTLTSLRDVDAETQLYLRGFKREK